MKDYKFNQLALAELVEGAVYYDTHRSGYGRYFLENVRAAIDFIRRHPLAGAVVRPATGVRAHTVKRFHHAVLYSIHGDLIYIIAIKHPARKPDYWLERLADRPG